MRKSPKRKDYFVVSVIFTLSLFFTGYSAVRWIDKKHERHQLEQIGRKRFVENVRKLAPKEFLSDEQINTLADAAERQARDDFSREN